jgi:WD40 repeat protein
VGRGDGGADPHLRGALPSGPLGGVLPRRGARVLSGGLGVKLWDAQTGAPIRTFEGHSLWVTAVAFSPDGARVLSGGGDKTVKLWDTATGALIRTFEGHSYYVSYRAER